MKQLAGGLSCKNDIQVVLPEKLMIARQYREVCNKIRSMRCVIGLVFQKVLGLASTGDLTSWMVYPIGAPEVFTELGRLSVRFQTF